jgi:UDP-N-acetylglucosamine 2-epimerase
MPIEDFARLMAHSSCLVGNSSAGIREAASFGTPVVNVGKRQEGRERNENILDCGTTFEQIKQAVDAAIQHGKFKSKNLYYKANAAKNISDDIKHFLELP